MSIVRLSFNYTVKKEVCGSTSFGCNLCFFSSPKFEALVAHLRNFHLSIKTEKIDFALSKKQKNEGEWNGTNFTPSYLQWKLANLAEHCVERPHRGIKFIVLKATCRAKALLLYYCPLCDKKSHRFERISFHLFTKHVQLIPGLVTSRYYLTLP
jgi:hypothetical protein